ncbi:MAG: recombinase family protein [Thermoplasmata archaeon]|nr:recombinase family protein [Thermoplasmata archaeon]RLF48409.1 MAG: recombinase family protein [Thermoplasmata archaeon]RLF62147.1 MAG: recombinase family protein [Thermoplasmata archaeon]
MDAQKNEPFKVAVYTRVSTEDQAKEGFSLDAQLDKLRAYCKARGWEIAGEYVDDGYSGRNTKRPAYQRMMQEMDKWDGLLVIKMDRIHRNSKNFMIMMEQLRENNKEFISMTESLDTSTAMGRFVMDIIQRIAQLESEQIGERVYVGMEQKAKTNGGILGFNIPYGYDYVDGKLVINKDEAEIVKKIYQWYLEGHSMGEIAETLVKQDVPTKKQGFWAKKTVSTILKNPLYCGYLRWEKYINKGEHEPIIDVETYNEVQKIIKQKGGKPASLIK